MPLNFEDYDREYQVLDTTRADGVALMIFCSSKAHYVYHAAVTLSWSFSGTYKRYIVTTHVDPFAWNWFLQYPEVMQLFARVNEDQMDVDAVVNVLSEMGFVNGREKPND